MRTSLVRMRFMIGCLLLAVLTGCATAARNPCEGVEGTCLYLSFDGESCTYEGPTELKTGPATLFFFNESEVGGSGHLIRHTGGETIQELIDYWGEGPSTGGAPGLVAYGTNIGVPPGESHTWEGVLDPGIHSLLCFITTAAGEPWQNWLGAVFAVED